MSLRLAIAAVMALALIGQADTLRLLNGSTINGTFLGGSSDEIRFMVNDQVQRFPRGDVAEVIFGSIGGSSPATPAPIVDPGPDVANVPFLRGASGYIPLEREYGMMSRGGGMYGMGGTVYRIQGMQSPVRVRQSDRIVFVVRSSGVDPRQFQLYRLDSRMGYRQTQPTMGGMPPSLPVTIKKTGDNLYELTPVRQLYPGEYALSPMNANLSYCFGVDY
jgi:hypothetical protein